MDMQCLGAKDRNKSMQFRKKCAEFLSEMTRTERNPPIQPEGEGVVLGYDHVSSCTNYKQKVVNLNSETCR